MAEDRSMVAGKALAHVHALERSSDDVSTSTDTSNADNNSNHETCVDNDDSSPGVDDVADVNDTEETNICSSTTAAVASTHPPSSNRVTTLVSLKCPKPVVHVTSVPISSQKTPRIRVKLPTMRTLTSSTPAATTLSEAAATDDDEVEIKAMVVDSDESPDAVAMVIQRQQSLLAASNAIEGPNSQPTTSKRQRNQCSNENCPLA